jgi:hypothetical protein
MQYDMHYTGTYALACAAGVPPRDAEIIATSAQLVDDHNFTDLFIFKDYKGNPTEGIEGVATAHHPLESGIRAVLPDGVGHDDSRKVWVPFHFLPGNQGPTFQERMICRKDSKIARTMMDFYTDQASIDAHRAHALHLMGVASHVYADTFAHYGFLGMESQLNSVDLDSIRPHETFHGAGIIDYLKQRATDFLGHFALEIASITPIGHGSAGTHPDRPYLRWSFAYTDGRTEERNNHADYMAACEALHGYFVRFVATYYGSPNPGSLPWADIKNTVSEILAFEGGADERIEAWNKAIREKRLGPAVVPAPYDHERWMDSIEQANELRTDDGSDIAHAYNFFAAASYHRNYVLKRLLPEAGLFVV